MWPSKPVVTEGSPMPKDTDNRVTTVLNQDFSILHHFLLSVISDVLIYLMAGLEKVNGIWTWVESGTVLYNQTGLPWDEGIFLH